VGVEWLMWSEKLRVWWGQLNLAHITETKNVYNKKKLKQKNASKSGHKVSITDHGQRVACGFYYY